MDILVTSKPEQVQSMLYRALEGLIINRIQDGSFTDEEEAKTKSYFSTLEGLEALLIPFMNLPKNQFWNPLKNKYSNLIDIISDDINFILSFNLLQDSPPDEQGEPYFEQRRAHKRSPYWTSECSSFTLSVLTNFLTLREKFDLPEEPKNKEIISVISKNLKWIHICKRGAKGWAWTNDSDAHPWPTWSLIDTFDEMIRCKRLLPRHMRGSISSECNEVIENIIKKFSTDESGSYLSDWNDRVIKRKPYDVATALDLSRLILAISLHKPWKEIESMAHMLFQWASISNFSKVDYRYHLKERADYIYDSSLVPCVLRTLILTAGILMPKGIKDLNEELGLNHEVVINKVYSKSMESLISHGKWKDLWGVRNDEFIYELYYTERTIEALTEFLEHYESKMSISEIESRRLSAAPDIKIESIKKEKPRKEETTDIKPADLPILNEFAGKTKEEKGDIFKNVILIYALHFLDDLIPFVEKFENLGCLYKDMNFLIKTYAYPQREKLQAYFSGKGCRISLPGDPHQKTFYELVGEILLTCFEQSKKQEKKILIIEDGGYFTPLFHSANFKKEAHRCFGSVEQTTKGYRRDTDIKDFQFPVISIASSAIKRYVEGPEVAETLQENMIKVLRGLDEKPIDKTDVLIIGYGNIGEELANALESKKLRTYIYDNDSKKRMKAEKSRYPYKDRVLENLDDLSLFDIIFGTSGETSLKKGEDYWTLKHNVILASGSSERIEFNLSRLEEQSSDIRRKGIFTKYHLKKGGIIVRLLCDGEPINFALSGGISNTVIDPVYAEMFWAAVELVTSTNLKRGMNSIPDRLDDEVYRLYKKRYRH